MSESRKNEEKTAAVSTKTVKILAPTTTRLKIEGAIAVGEAAHLHFSNKKLMKELCKIPPKRCILVVSAAAKSGSPQKKEVNMIIGRPLAILVHFVTGIAAFITVGMLAVYYVNLQFGFITGEALTKFVFVKDIAVMLVVGLAGLEFALKRNVILFLIFAAIAAVGIGFMIYGGVFVFGG